MDLPMKVRERVEELAVELRQLLYGSQGTPPRGVTFALLENEACEVGDAVTRCLLSQALQEHADQTAAAPERSCAVCGRSSAAEDIQPRIVQTRRGEVAWREPQYYCRKCRQAFFPSEP